MAVLFRERPKFRCILLIAFFLFANYIYSGEAYITAPAKAEKAGNISVCFSPDGNCVNLILETIGSSVKKIDVAVYSLTSLELSKALIKAKKNGVRVRVITDKAQSDDKYSKYQYLSDSGIESKLCGNSGKMHDKFAVIDGRFVLTGSYNWSLSAENRNNENLISIDDPKIANIYESEFERIWNRCR
jgi:phosphatidylserine/phosphatidylglycerophosphate/cardiolipin synthase-like enzyme